MADPRRATRVRFRSLVLADPVSVFASLLAPAPLRATRFSCLPTILAWELEPRVRSLGLGERFAMGEDWERLKQRIPLLEYLQRHHWTGHRADARSEFVGLCPLHE